MDEVRIVPLSEFVAGTEIYIAEETLTVTKVDLPVEGKTAIWVTLPRGHPGGIVVSNKEVEDSQRSGKWIVILPCKEVRSEAMNKEKLSFGDIQEVTKLYLALRANLGAMHSIDSISFVTFSLKGLVAILQVINTPSTFIIYCVQNTSPICKQVEQKKYSYDAHEAKGCYWLPLDEIKE